MGAPSGVPIFLGYIMKTYKVTLEVKCKDKPTWIKSWLEAELEYDHASAFSVEGEELISFDVEKREDG